MKVNGNAPCRQQPRGACRILIGSIMEEPSKAAWHELIGKCDGIFDAFEINFSCPHGMPERRMGMAMGQCPELLEEVRARTSSHTLRLHAASRRHTHTRAQVCGWVGELTSTPVWAKMTPNITDITDPARAALRAGTAGVSAINTIQSVMSINLDTLKPEPCVEGHSTPGGYSGPAVKPIALAKCMEVSRLIRDEYGGERSLSGIGGVETGGDAAEFLLLGASTVQVRARVCGLRLIERIGVHTF